MKRNTALKFLVPFLVILVCYIGVRIWWTGQYDSEDFNCADMSRSLAPVFQDLGFDTKIIYGINNDSAHCWLSLNGLYFDATSLWFNDENEYKVNFIDSPPFGYWDELGIVEL